MVYTAGSVSLAVLEMLVHFCSEEVLKRYVLFEVSFDDSLVRRLTMKELPRNWRSSPPPGRLQRIGDAWCTEGASPVLQVPSVIVPAEWNYLLNPGHRDLHELIIGSKQAVRLDPRLMG